MSTPTDFIWSFGGGLRKVEEKEWMHDWMGQIKVRTSEDDSSSTKSFGDEPYDSDATSQCSEIVYESGQEPEEESPIIERLSTVMESHQELSSQCEAVLMRKGTSWPEKELSVTECSQMSSVVELHQDLPSQCEAVLMHKESLPKKELSSRISTMMSPPGVVKSMVKSMEAVLADKDNSRPQKDLLVAQCSQISTVIELHQELSSQCEAVLMHKESLPEEELSSRISTVMELHQELSSQCEAALAHKDNSNNQTQSVDHLSTVLADALRELQATKAANESLERDYQELMKDHRSLQDKHAMLGVTNDALKKVNCSFDALRALAMEVYDSLNFKHQKLMSEHRDLSRENAALKRRTNRDSLLGLQTVVPQTEEDFLGVLAQQIY